MFLKFKLPQFSYIINQGLFFCYTLDFNISIGKIYLENGDPYMILVLGQVLFIQVMDVLYDVKKLSFYQHSVAQLADNRVS